MVKFGNRPTYCLHKLLLFGYHQDKKIEAVNLPKQLNEGCFFLVDSKKARNSAELIHFFMQEGTKEPIEKDFLKPMKVAVERSIEALIEQDCSTIKQQMAIITALQFMYLPPMIPRSMTNLGMTGIESQDFYPQTMRGRWRRICLRLYTRLGSY